MKKAIYISRTFNLVGLEDRFKPKKNKFVSKQKLWAHSAKSFLNQQLFSYFNSR